MIFVEPVKTVRTVFFLVLLILASHPTVIKCQRKKLDSFGNLLFVADADVMVTYKCIPFYIVINKVGFLV